jgi:response regulator RpfG family c-di-GMP phosphodiesterase
MTGIELLKKTADRRPHMVRILLTGYTDIEDLIEAVNCGLVYMYVSKPWDNNDLKLRIGRAVQLYEFNKRQHSLVAANERLEMRLKEMKLGLIRATAKAIKLKDEYTFLHGSRVGKCAAVIGENLGLAKHLLTDLTAAALLHDLGAIGTPEEILLKSGELSNHERFLRQRHPESGARILNCVAELRDIADIIKYHHENYDGSGYPVGLVGEQIPITSRIVRVASEYDSLTTPRNLSEAISHGAAIENLGKRMGSELDPRVVTTLMELEVDEIRELLELNAIQVRPDLINYAIN